MAASASVNQKELNFQEAVREGREEEVKRHLRQGVNPNCPTLVFSPLHTAISTAASPRASRGLSDRIITVITLLLDAGAETNSERRGSRPIHLAAGINNEEIALRIAELLMERGADPSLRNGRGQRADEIAKSGDLKILLLRRDLASQTREARVLRRRVGELEGRQRSRICVLV